jgi:hypothetical protein
VRVVLFGRSSELVQTGARPKIGFKLFIQPLHALQSKKLAKNGGPACDGDTHQQRDDQLHHKAGMQDELKDGEVLVHVL